MARVLYIVGGPPRVGKSALGRRVMEDRGVPWLSTDIVRTVVRSADRQIDELDRGHPDPDLVAERMYPYLERAVDVAHGVDVVRPIAGVAGETVDRRCSWALMPNAAERARCRSSMTRSSNLRRRRDSDW